MTAIQIVTLVIATLGLVVASCSLVWNLALYRLQGARAKVRAVGGSALPGGVSVLPVTDELAGGLKETFKSLGGTVVFGVEVTNTGRMPLQMQSWSLSIQPSGARYVGIPQFSGPTTPCEIKPGGVESFLFIPTTAAAAAKTLAKSTGVEQSVCCEVHCGGRTYRTRAFRTRYFE